MPNSQHIKKEHVSGAMYAIEKIVDSEAKKDTWQKIWKNERERKEKLATLLLVWSFYESGLQASAVGDAGNSCGVMQVNKWHTAGIPCNEISKSHYLGYFVGVSVMTETMKTCKNDLVGAMSLYASGKSCKHIPFVKRRIMFASNFLKKFNLSLQQPQSPASG